MNKKIKIDDITNKIIVCSFAICILLFLLYLFLSLAEKPTLIIFLKLFPKYIIESPDESVNILVSVNPIIIKLIFICFFWGSFGLWSHKNKINSKQGKGELGADRLYIKY